MAGMMFDPTKTHSVYLRGGGVSGQAIDSPVTPVTPEMPAKPAGLPRLRGGGVLPAAPAVAAGSQLPGRFDPLAPTVPNPMAGLNALPGIEGQKDWSSAQAVGTKFGLPSAGQIALDKAHSASAQQASDQAIGIGGGSSNNPLNVNVTRQANGNLSFSGVGGGEGVNYTGMPKWSSQSGGAGRGGIGYSTGGSMGNSGFDLASQNAKMASALQGIRDFDRQKKVDAYTDAIASGVGGAVGVAQNKIALAGLGDIVQQQMRGDNAASINQTNDATRRASIAADVGMSAARDATSRYGVDTQAKTAQTGFEVEKQKAAAAMAAAQIRAAAGKPATMKDKTALFVFGGRNADGTARTPEQQAEVERRYAYSFGNRDSLAGLMQSYQNENENE